MSQPGWCDCCDTDAEPERICSRGHKAIMSLRLEVLCRACACSNPAVVYEDGCRDCQRAIGTLIKPAKRRRHACAS